MRDESLFFLYSPVSRIKGIGGQTAVAFQRLLPAATNISGSTMPIVRDLLFHLPVGIVDRRATWPLREAPDGAVGTFIVTVDEHQAPKSTRFSKAPYKVLCSNETGDITLVFFHASTDYITGALPVGSKRVISGRVEHFDYKLQMPHPDIITTVDKLAEVQQSEPIYPLTVGLTTRRIAKFVEMAMEKLPAFPEWINEESPPPLRGRVREGGAGVGGGGAAKKGGDFEHRYTDAAINNAKNLRNNPTDAENKLWQLLRRKQLEQYKFRRQQPVGNYITDFFCPELKLVIELDGGQHAQQEEYDKKRTEFLEAKGYRVLRFWNNDVLQNIEGIYETIVQNLAPPPNPLPQGEGEPAFLSFKSALYQAHHPQTLADLEPTAPARLRLAYDEILAMQLHLAMLRRNMQRQSGEVIKGSGALTKALLASLPFQLTAGQKKILQEIEEDLASGHRMGRLLQGDVGSGKTVVALLAMLRAVEQGLQTALMVPTEIIAQQHFETLGRLTAVLDIKIVLLTGSVKGKAREQALADIASGAAQIVIGTHALFQEKVQFANLALVVIDEQHRFGVGQRGLLTAKGHAPHVLHMTATPIPRSLTMTIYGDMDCSNLREKPAERLPITTRVIPLARYQELMERMKAALDRGEKVYWICPMIEGAENAAEDAAAVQNRFVEFKARFGNTVGLVHGRMKADERDEAMRRFAGGETRLLVATTVVEVGVDVRDATIMVVERAERFGLSQLHQLRGRVGRGDKQSACVLLYSEAATRPDDRNTSLSSDIRHPSSSDALRRLSILRETEDGFKIAEADLGIRGGGDLLGTRQSGLPRFIFTDIIQHMALLEHAREDAAQFLKTDPNLESERGKTLRILLQLFGYEAN